MPLTIAEINKQIRLTLSTQIQDSARIFVEKILVEYLQLLLIYHFAQLCLCYYNTDKLDYSCSLATSLVLKDTGELLFLILCYGKRCMNN